MGACAILPRIIGQGRAAELLYTGRVMGGEEAERWGFFNRLSSPENVLADATALANELCAGPTFANGMTKRMLEMEWAMSVEQSIEAEAVAQALVHGDAKTSSAPSMRLRPSRSRYSRAIECRSPKPSPGPSSMPAIANSPSGCRAGPPKICTSCRMTMSTRPAVRA